MQPGQIRPRELARIKEIQTTLSPGLCKQRAKVRAPTQVTVSAPHESEASSWLGHCSSQRQSQKDSSQTKPEVGKHRSGDWTGPVVTTAEELDKLATEQALGITPQLMTVPLHFSNGLRFVQRFAPEIWLLASFLAISGLFGAGGAERRRSRAMQQLTLCWMTRIVFLSFARAWFGNYSWLVVAGSMILCFILLLSALRGIRRLGLKRTTKRAKKCARPAGSRCGPILTRMQCSVSAAPKVNKKRVLGAHRRGHHEMAPALLPASTRRSRFERRRAGDRVTARKRQENQLLLLANQITSLAEQVKIHASCS